MKKIAVLVSGSGSNLEAIIDACNQNIIDGDVIKVISNNPKAYGLVRAKNLISHQKQSIIKTLIQEKILTKL